MSMKKPETRKFKNSETLWWAHSKAHGWVILDKTLTRNRCSFRPEEYTFIRCRDWCEYEQGHQPWNYTEAGRYLEKLSSSEALAASRELEKLQGDFESRRA